MARKSTQTHAKKNVADDPSYRKMKADYYPVQRTFELATAGTCDHMLCDVGQVLSRTNHRLYRQGKTYSIKLDLSTTATAGTYTVYALVDTWYLMKAWQMARATYLKATAEERKQMGTSTARWEDFRVNAGLTLANVSLGYPRFYDRGGTAGNITAGEFVNSKIYREDTGAAMEFSVGLTDALAYGIIDEYAQANNTDQDPQGVVSATPPYSGVDNEVNGLQTAALGNDGNAPPYDATDFGTRWWVKIAELRNDSPNATKLSTGFFNAPLGLFYVSPPSGTFTFDNEISLTVQNGNYKGVKAMNMGV